MLRIDLDTLKRNAQTMSNNSFKTMYVIAYNGTYYIVSDLNRLAGEDYKIVSVHIPE